MAAQERSTRRGATATTLSGHSRHAFPGQPISEGAVPGHSGLDDLICLADAPRQRYRCFVIPEFAAPSGNLPPRVHQATWEDMVDRFGYNAQRRSLLDGLKQALDSLALAGCQRAYIDGSFVTAKEIPGDFDACWETGGVDPLLLDPDLLDFRSKRAAQRARYGGELFLADAMAGPPGVRYLEFFQRDRDTGAPKGIVSIDLRSLP